MNSILNIDKAGRIVLPKPVREELSLSPGDSLEMESSGDRIVLRPRHARPRVYKKHGIWVLHTESPLDSKTVKDTIKKVYEEREARFLGKPR